jgi:hypothetical protein
MLALHVLAPSSFIFMDIQISRNFNMHLFGSVEDMIYLRFEFLMVETVKIQGSGI